MENDLHSVALPTSRNWVDTTLVPSVTSGMIGGGVLGFTCGYLLAPPHHFVETITGSAGAGVLVGLVMTWIGAAAVGLFRYLIYR
jgi:hypothetical protein